MSVSIARETPTVVTKRARKTVPLPGVRRGNRLRYGSAWVRPGPFEQVRAAKSDGPLYRPLVCAAAALSTVDRPGGGCRHYRPSRTVHCSRDSRRRGGVERRGACARLTRVVRVRTCAARKRSPRRHRPDGGDDDTTTRRRRRRRRRRDTR